MLSRRSPLLFGEATIGKMLLLVVVERRRSKFGHISYLLIDEVSCTPPLVVLVLFMVGFNNNNAAGSVIIGLLLLLFFITGPLLFQLFGPVLKLVSLDRLGLEAVRDKHAGGGRVSGRRRPMSQASWCSMKLSTLVYIHRHIKIQ